MTNKERMLTMVLDDKKLQELYGYDRSDYEDMYTAINSDNLVVSTTARIVRELNGSNDETVHNKLYKTIFNYLTENILI